MSRRLPVGRGALPLLIVAGAFAGACIRDHTYTFRDVEALAPGRSARAEVEKALHVADGAATRIEEDGAVTYASTAFRWRPSFPWLVFTYPVYHRKAEEQVAVTAWYDARGTLARGRIVAGRFLLDSLLLLLNPHGWDRDYPLEIDPDSAAALRRLRSQGWDVRFRVGYDPEGVPLGEGP